MHNSTTVTVSHMELGHKRWSKITYLKFTAGYWQRWVNLSRMSPVSTFLTTTLYWTIMCKMDQPWPRELNQWLNFCHLSIFFVSFLQNHVLSWLEEHSVRRHSASIRVSWNRGLNVNKNAQTLLWKGEVPKKNTF